MEQLSRKVKNTEGMLGVLTATNEFLRNVFSLECDSDTFGAIAGGVAEEFYHGFGSVEADKILREYLPKELFEILEM